MESPNIFRSHLVLSYSNNAPDYDLMEKLDAPIELIAILRLVVFAQSTAFDECSKLSNILR